MEVKAEEFKNRCYTLDYSGKYQYSNRFFCYGLRVERVGKDKFKFGNKKGNWKEIYNAILTQLAE